MKPLSLLSSLFFIMIFSGYSCKKEPPLPPLTIGNKMSCKFNGQNWESSDIHGGIFFRPADNYKYIYVYAYRGNEILEIYSTRPFTTGTKLFNENTQSQFYTAYPKNYGSYQANSQIWMTNATDIGQCNFISLDSLTIKCQGHSALKPVTNQPTRWLK